MTGRQTPNDGIGLVAYFAATDDETPDWAKAVLGSALGHLVVPTDAKPDVGTIAGFSDDATAIATAICDVGRTRS